MQNDESYGFDFDFDFAAEPARHVKREPLRRYGQEEEAFMNAFLKAYSDDRGASVVSTYFTFLAALRNENLRRDELAALRSDNTRPDELAVLQAPSLRTFHRRAKEYRRSDWRARRSSAAGRV